MLHSAAEPIVSLPLYRARRMDAHINPIDLALFLLGAAATLVAYFSFLPLVATSMFYGTALLLLCVKHIGGFYERRIFTRLFAVGFVMAGVAAIYANYLQDPYQLENDPGRFFEAATERAKHLALLDIRDLTEGSLAVVMWRAVYEFFDIIGFPRERYLGILVNVTAVAFSGVVALKTSRLIFGNDPERFRRLTTLFSACGLLWLFAALHMRDAIVLLAVTALAHAWVYFLEKPDLGRRLLFVSASSLAAVGTFEFLRTEFLFVPIVMAAAGMLAVMIGRRNSSRLVGYVLGVIALVALVGLLAAFGEELQAVVVGGRDSYLKVTEGAGATESLAMVLIIKQDTLTRLVLGSAYLLVFPIPFWTGFQLESAYLLFKTFSAVYFYFLTPLVALAIWQLWKQKVNRTPAILFVLMCSLGFLVSIAGSSLETRHFGAFFGPMVVLALLPDLSSLVVRRHYKRLLVVMLMSIAVVHVVWIILKM